MQRIYLERVLDNALAIEGEWDYVVVHDPQPAAMLSFLRETALVSTATSGSGAATSTSPTRTTRCGSSSARSSSSTTPSVWTMPEFVPASLSMDRVVHAPPCIDPLSVKNLDLAEPFCNEIASSTASTRGARSCAR